MFNKAIAPYPTFCDGFGNPGAIGSSYVLTLALSVSSTRKKFTHNGSSNLDEIIAFDKAEVSGPNIGQINMIHVSSFCGPNGLIWGYDIARADMNFMHSIEGYPLYDAGPLVDATTALFGTVAKPRFPIFPGSHVPCACRKIIAQGSDTEIIYSGIGIGIPKDRTAHACILMEDAGSCVSENPNDEMIIGNLAKSVIEISKIQQYELKEILVSLKKLKLSSDEYGCALTIAPYIVLAQDAIPTGGFDELRAMPLDEWKKSF